MKLNYEQINNVRNKMLYRKGLLMNFEENQQFVLNGIYREPYNAKDAEEFRNACDKGADEDFELSKYSEFTLKFVHEYKILNTTQTKEINFDEMIRLNPDIKIDL